MVSLVPNPSPTITTEALVSHHDEGRISDDEALAIARELVREVRAVPGDPAGELLAQRRELSPADEARVEAALVKLGAADPEDTTAAEGEKEVEGEREEDRTA